MSLRNDIYDMLEPIAAVPLIWGYLNGPRPADTYIQMHASNTDSPDHDHQGQVDEAGGMPIEGYRETTLELVAFGDDGEARLNNIVQRLHTPTQADRAQSFGLAFYDASSVRNLPIKRDDARWEPRSMVELGVRWIHRITDNVGLIERVEYQADMNGRTTDHTIEVSHG